MAVPEAAAVDEGAATASIRSALVDQLRTALDRDPDVAAALRAWDRFPGAEDAGEPVERAAARHAEVCVGLARYRGIVGSDPPAALDRSPVAPFADLPPLPPVEERRAEVAAATAADPAADAHRIGADYAEALGDAERRRRGQFYTPQEVAEFVVEWALDAPARRGDDAVERDGPPRVLDPAAGTGTFPLATLESTTRRHPAAEADELLGRLVAVDVDDVALHLAGLRLSAYLDGRSVGAFDRRTSSFFDLEPGADVAPVDAVVGNPPFVRARELTPDREHFRAHLAALGPDGESPYADGDRALSGRSDASVYFLTHATRFLRPGGRLGVVLPAKWLESEYGVDFRRFLADHYRIEAVVGFGARTFDALVDTVLLLAERRERSAAAGDADVRFVRLDGEFEPGAARALVEGGSEVADGEGNVTEVEGDCADVEGDCADVDGDVVGTASDSTDAGADGDGGAGSNRGATRGRVVRRPQARVATARQCSPYLRAPADLLELLEHPALVPLGDLADVSRGVTTGANAFFLVGDDDRSRWGLEDRILRPACRSIRGVETRTLEAADLDRSIVDVHGVVAARVDVEAAEDPTAAAKAALRAAGHGGLADYVESAEADGAHEGRTCRSRRVWFDLGDLAAPDAFVPKLCRERVFTVRNRAGAVPTNAIDCLDIHDDVDAGVLLGVLDSSLCRGAMEVWGRDEAGLLQLMTAETRTLPVPDVRRLSPGERRSIRRAADDLASDGTGQAALDAAVVDAFDLVLDADRLRAIREDLLRRRVEGGERVEGSTAD